MQLGKATAKYTFGIFGWRSIGVFIVYTSWFGLRIASGICIISSPLFKHSTTAHCLFLSYKSKISTLATEMVIISRTRAYDDGVLYFSPPKSCITFVVSHTCEVSISFTLNHRRVRTLCFIAIHAICHRYGTKSKDGRAQATPSWGMHHWTKKQGACAPDLVEVACGHLSSPRTAHVRWETLASIVYIHVSCFVLVC